jgi:hypothetical protein
MERSRLLTRIYMQHGFVITQDNIKRLWQLTVVESLTKV